MRGDGGQGRTGVGLERERECDRWGLSRTRDWFGWNVIGTGSEGGVDQTGGGQAEANGEQRVE